MGEMTDDELAANFVARRPEALEEAYRAHAAVLYSVARHVLGSDADAQDCVHDALLRVWSRPDSYRPERGSLRSFLSVCVRNEAIGRKRDAARHFQIEQRLAIEEPEQLYEQEIADPIDRARLHGALASLPVEQRQALELGYFHHLSHAQIAEKLGVPLGTIKSRLAMGLRKLQSALPAQPAGRS
jgi:RNA polymerase sigma-70 factor (ECF subfamily)